MILVDTSIWIDHLRARDETLVLLLNAGRVLLHPFVIGELALGSIKRRDRVLAELLEQPRVKVATDDEVLKLIEVHQLFGRGMGYVDAHLLAAVRLTHGATFWTRDRRLHRIADGMGLAIPLLR